MSNFIASARSNYFRVTDFDGLKTALAPFEIAIDRHPSQPDYVCLEGAEDGSGWPSSGCTDDDAEVEFDPEQQICRFMAPGEVLIMMEVGAEKLRYLCGRASAYRADGKQCHVSLDQIYNMVETELGAAPGSFACATWQDLPENSTAPCGRSS